MRAPAIPAARNPRRAGAESRAALAALVFVLGVTAIWWALALWPTPGAPPAWLARARWVCFNVDASGLPDTAGWLLLVGQPLGLVLVLLVAFGRSLRAGIEQLLSSASGRALAAACALSVLGGLAAAGARVAEASSFDPRAGAALPAEPVSDSYPRLDRPAPALGLVDQRGERVELARLRGRPALVTFAFAHCETVCPGLVQRVLAAQARVRESDAPAERVPRVAIVTLDPWRDTPARLPALAAAWRLADDGEARVLSGEVDAVNALLDRWNVPRARNSSTGQLDHPALVYVLDPEGRIAYAANGDVESLVALLARE